ncbi:MAG: hypothetical protein IIX48_05090 [Lachnospiraceae bacterium]|nr:hypothetical protein [Lachnospiraceae bacterium]
MTTGKYYTTLHKNLKGVSENFKNDGIYDVCIVKMPETFAYLFCGFDSNYLFEFLCDDSTDESLFTEFTDEQVDALYHIADIYKLTGSDEEEATTKATTYLDKKLLALAKKAIHSFGNDKRAALSGMHC